MVESVINLKEQNLQLMNKIEQILRNYERNDTPTSE